MLNDTLRICSAAHVGCYHQHCALKTGAHLISAHLHLFWLEIWDYCVDFHPVCRCYRRFLYILASLFCRMGKMRKRNAICFVKAPLSSQSFTNVILMAAAKCICLRGAFTARLLNMNVCALQSYLLRTCSARIYECSRSPLPKVL